MLSLTRRVGQEVILRVHGIEIIVRLSSAGAGRAKLGFTAPQEVVIVRREIEDKPKRSNGSQ